MSLTADEQALADAANATLPTWFSANARVQEEVGMMAKQNGLVLAKIKHQVAMTYVGQAVGEIGSGNTFEPDWLELLAEDRGTLRQPGELDPNLRTRINRAPAGVIRAEILAAVQAMVDAAGIVGTAAMVELPRDQACSGDIASPYVADSGTGGTFVENGDGTFTFQPTTGLIYPPFVDGLPGLVGSTSITITGAADSGNDGTFPIVSMPPILDGDDLFPSGVTFANILGVDATDATVTWATTRYDRGGAPLEGFARAFSGCGYRGWRGKPVGETGRFAPCGMIVILPYGCTSGMQAGITEAVRQLKAAGVGVVVEVNQTP